MTSWLPKFKLKGTLKVSRQLSLTHFISTFPSLVATRFAEVTPQEAKSPLKNAPIYSRVT